MAPINTEAQTAAAIARLEQQMIYVVAEVSEMRAKLDALNKARWLGSGVLIAIGAGGMAGLSKIAAILLPAIGR